MPCKNDQQNIVLVDTLKVTGALPESVLDRLSVEEPLEIHFEGISDGIPFASTIAVTMRTPGSDGELAVGFLYSEGIIQERSDVVDVKTRGCNFVSVSMRDGIAVNLDQFARHSFVNSSCGVCGKKSVESIVDRVKVQIDNAARVSREVIGSLPSLLRQKQPDFESTGGIHASALFDLEGSLCCVREDVGRHNALDKLIGAQFLAGNLPLNEHILFLSGRASFELIQKAAMAAIPIVCAVGAPSSLAVELARDCGITLLGFVRDDRFNVYTQNQRILL